MYSSENVDTRHHTVNVLGGTAPESSTRFGFDNVSSSELDRFTVGELVTVLPAGTIFPMPLRVQIQVGCGAPEFGYAQLTQASVSDLLARVSEAIQASLNDKRRSEADELPEKSSKIIRFGQVEVDFQTMELYRSGIRVHLTAHEFKTLRYFLSRPKAVISREEFLKHVWGYQHCPTTRTVDNRILKLRQKLEPNPSQPTHFLTVQGVGYKFVP